MKAMILALRPKQWIKNGFVVAPIFFSLQFTSQPMWLLVLAAAAAFCFAASFVYVFNDIKDREEDRQHPIKKMRPIASGALSVRGAVLVGVACFIASMAFLQFLPTACLVVVLSYIALNGLYTMVLKHHALLDVFFIALCFVLRVLMGCYALGAVVSPWIILTTFMLALFIGFGKRYNELGVEGYKGHKQNLQHYSRELLDKLIIICASAALVCYAVYTTEMATLRKDPALVYTVVFVAFGLFRYLQTIYVFGKGGEPESVILRDKWQWVNIALWLASTVWILSS